MKTWGKCSLININGCNPDRIRSADNILLWGQHLISTIGMKVYGPPFIERFAVHDEDAVGYTYFQAIETSNVTAHFSETNNTAFIHVFSCKDFSTSKVILSCLDYFECEDYHVKSFDMLVDGSIK